MKENNVRRQGNQFELIDRPKNHSLWNRDIHPTPIKDRNWSKWHIAGLWIAMSVNITTYMLGSSLIGEGMNWWEAILTVFVGCIIVLIPITLISRPGVKYGIPFPVLVRSSFGTEGAKLAALLRAFVACGWFGIQSSIGGSAIYIILAVFIPNLKNSYYLGSFVGLNIAQLICILLFWLTQMYVISHGINIIRRLSVVSAPLLLLFGVGIFCWAWYTVGSFPEILSATYLLGKKENVLFWQIFCPGVTAIVGYWSTLALNIPDFMRFAKSQKDQVIGQFTGLPLAMVMFTFIGIIVTGATMHLFGKAIWDPVVLLGKFSNPALLFISLFCILLATTCSNITANVVSPANDFTNLLPKLISFRTGGYITAIIGMLIMPWKLIADPSGYIFRWLIAYSALLGAMAGIMICDLYLIHKTKLCLNNLFAVKGKYYYTKGWNIFAYISFIIGVIPNIPGFTVQVGLINASFFPAWINNLYNYAWFISFIISFIAYLILMKFFKKPFAGQIAEEAT
jgi:nucleobase:cation symporter-1, NCS1 family